MKIYDFHRSFPLDETASFPRFLKLEATLFLAL